MVSKAHLPSHFRDWNNSANGSINIAGKSAAQKPLWKRPWFVCVAVAVAIAVIIAIVVPLAVVLPNKGKKHDASVMVPLYIYPTDNSTWSPLYEALQTHPTLEFTVIINPSSGPGSSQYPNNDYTVALNQLANYPNVKKVGYVRTGYATRNLSDVIAEVNVFAGWSNKGAAFTMEGIFFDESPHEYTSDAGQFMLHATQTVKNASGIRGKKTVIRNPGVVPDAQFSDANTDISVVFEQSYAEYETQVSALSKLKDGRDHHCYMVHSIPNKSKKEYRGYVDDLSKRAEWLFATANDQNYYESFGSDWATFVDAIPTKR